MKNEFCFSVKIGQPGFACPSLPCREPPDPGCHLQPLSPEVPYLENKAIQVPEPGFQEPRHGGLVHGGLVHGRLKLSELVANS